MQSPGVVPVALCVSPASGCGPRSATKIRSPFGASAAMSGAALSVNSPFNATVPTCFPDLVANHLGGIALAIEHPEVFFVGSRYHNESCFPLALQAHWEPSRWSQVEPHVAVTIGADPDVPALSARDPIPEPNRTVVGGPR